jgi:hypothetical protein
MNDMAHLVTDVRTTVKREAVRALIQRERVRMVIASRFSRTWNRTDLVRCSVVAASVADALVRENSYQHRRECRLVCAEMGWRQIVRAQNVASYRFMVGR